MDFLLLTIRITNVKMRDNELQISRGRALAAFIFAAAILLCGWRSEGAGGDFVDIMAELRCTNRVQYGGREYPKAWKHSVHCIVGTNVWFIEGDFASNADIALLFTGTNTVEHVVMKEGYGGKAWTNTRPSDGVISRGAGVQNLAWLAFCSGPYLKRSAALALPAQLGWFEDNVDHDRRQMFSDELGLPRSVDFFSPRPGSAGDKTVYFPSGHYRVLESTNFLGWTFPLSFEVRQSAGPGGGDGEAKWDGAELVIVGNVISIQQGTRPSIPAPGVLLLRPR